MLRHATRRRALARHSRAALRPSQRPRFAILRVLGLGWIDWRNDANADHERHDRHRRGLDARRTCSIDGETIAAIGANLAADGIDAPTRRSTQPASTSSRARSTSTPTWSCRSAARSPRTRSRPAPGRRRSAGRRRSSTSRSSHAARSLREGLDAWHAKAEGNAVADYGFHMIMSDVNDDTLGGDGRARRRGRPRLQALHRVPGRLLQRRRGDLPGDAADREERRADHDARRERDGDRRRRGRRGRRRPHRSLLPRRRPLPDLRGRGDEPGDPPGRGGRRCRSTSSTSRRATP